EKLMCFPPVVGIGVEERAVVAELKSILPVWGEVVVRTQIRDTRKKMRNFFGRQHGNPRESGSNELPLQALFAKDLSHAQICLWDSEQVVRIPHRARADTRYQCQRPPNPK